MTQLYPMPCITDDDAEESTATEQSPDVFLGEKFEAIMRGATLKEIYGISDQVMNAIYAHAYNFYQSGRNDDAKTFFQFLCAYDIYNADYVMGLAAVHQRQKDFLSAIQLYRLSYAIEPKNTRCMLYAGQCYLYLKDKVNAYSCFSIVAEHELTDSIKKQAQGYLSVFKPEERQGKHHG